MRKWNAVISAVILVLFFIHAVTGGFLMAGLLPGGNGMLTGLAHVLMSLIGVHALIGLILTIKTFLQQKKAGVSYPGENKLFWARRISGFAILILMEVHLRIFMVDSENEPERLRFFGSAQLVTQLLFVAALAVHVIANVRPLLIGLGIPRLKKYAADILIMMSVLLMFIGLMFVVYYLRWAAL